MSNSPRQSTMMKRFQKKRDGWKRDERRFCLAILILIILNLVPVSVHSQTSEDWRRTARGWERKQVWEQQNTYVFAKLEPLSSKNVWRRTWPATVAAAELCLILSVLTTGKRQNQSHLKSTPILDHCCVSLTASGSFSGAATGCVVDFDSSFGLAATPGAGSSSPLVSGDDSDETELSSSKIALNASV